MRTGTEVRIGGALQVECFGLQQPPFSTGFPLEATISDASFGVGCGGMGLSRQASPSVENPV